MADVSEGQIRKAVAQATADVLAEARGYERELFKISDLRPQLDEFAGGKLDPGAAWTISYKTSAAVGVEQLGELGAGGAVAWTISYKTAANIGIEEPEFAEQPVARRSPRV
jgi:hypothetical protein